MTSNGSSVLVFLAACLTLAGCDRGPGGAGASVPAPSNVIDAVPTDDDGERGSMPLPATRPAARPQAQAVAELQPDDAADDEAPEPATPTTTLNTTPPKVTAPATPPPIVITPPTPSPAPEPTLED